MFLLSFCPNAIQSHFFSKKVTFLSKPVYLETWNKDQRLVKLRGLQCAVSDENDCCSNIKSFEKRKKRQFTSEEDKLIIQLREKDKLSWREIGKRLNRHGYVCNIRYKYNLRSRNSVTSFGGDKWSHLEVLVNELGPDWKRIAEILQFSKPEEVRNKYSELMARKKQYSVMPLASETSSEEQCWEQVSKEFPQGTTKQARPSSLECLVPVNRRQGSFTVEEDKFLLEQLRKYGSDWNRIVEDFPWRTRRTVMKRLQQLSMKSGSSRGRKLVWTENEDNLLIDLFIQHGRCWSLISRSLFGKSASQCLRRFLKLRKDGKVTITEWTQSDDKRLVCSVGLYNENWPLISRVLKYWSYSECERRYQVLQRENKVRLLERMVMKEVRRGKSSELLSSCTIHTDEYGFLSEGCSSSLQEIFFG
ncbi:hypothetical protein Gasu2_03410 [Galdieria sulphuraria]|uniref:Myb-like protein n=1 Tax=Galdieria sulphuraria TaxID=130081 RepID=M2Y077_GALSU|nr:Myb-like protein [Galdieria sulphuraria]EME29293.1 Myb-like protein [Galdieria sulphuraria]GJD05897.1 hypothetical protein Gasu2_03410 [Galdieria sulphuraria]|eukprot:XP_005705813.1 Myb-like protein [Galdieria sulphuraria]